MRTSRLLTLALVLAALPAAAETPLNCTQGTVKKIAVSADKTRLRFRGDFTPPPGFDPSTGGLTLELAYEPEADPANILYTVTLPNLTTTSRGYLYKDKAGTVGGITLVRFSDNDGVFRVTVSRTGAAIAGATRAATLRLVLVSGTACVRTCGSACAFSHGTRLACAASTDTALCGTRSGCELLNLAGGHCMFPYPSTAFERDDGSTPTGKRINFLRLGMPMNKSGVHIDPEQWNILDGYSAGTIGMVHFPQGVDLTLSGVPSLLDFASSVAPGSPTVLVDADTLEHVEHFGELDVTATAANQVFMIRPGRRLKNGGHYIFAIRNLVAPGGAPIAAEPAFAALRDNTPSGSARLEARRSAFNALFTTLTAAGVPRPGLILAWEFHVVSDDALERYLLKMRDETFAQLGPNAPAFAVDTVEDDPFGDPRVCRRVTGHYSVPLYTTFNGPGSILNINTTTNLPEQNGVASDVPFTAIIPCSLMNPTPSAGRPIFYGHGLLGKGFNEVSSDHLRTLANTYGYVVVATDWQGMSEDDLPTIIPPNGIIKDFSNFRKLPDRLHQGILNQLVLGHLLGAPDGLSTDPAFQYDDGGTPVSVIDPTEVFYYGNSQGGIFGGTVMALAQETTRGVLGVPGANFSTLLQRSRDFILYFNFLNANYLNELDRIITYPIIQMLWDRAEPNGWYHHTVSNPLPGSPAHKVLVHMATSDDEVCNLGTEIMVRSMGIAQLTPVVKSYYNVAEVAAGFDGSAMLESDGAFGPVPITNTPPADNSAHGDMRRRPAIQAQIDQFLRTGGSVQNFCAGPCDPE